MSLWFIEGSERMTCPDPDCTSGDFWLRPDGQIVCADYECHAIYGRWTRDDGAAPEPERIP